VGGIGYRGPGETKLETGRGDACAANCTTATGEVTAKRTVHVCASSVVAQRSSFRGDRWGHTNAGKSTLLNAFN